MSLSVGSNRVMSQRTTLKKTVENQEEPKKTETKQTAESPKVNVSAQQKAVQVSNSALLANRGVQVHKTDSMSMKPPLNRVSITIDNVDLFYRFLNGEFKLKKGDIIYVAFDDIRLKYEVLNDDGEMKVSNIESPAKSSQKESTGLGNNKQVLIQGGQVNNRDQLLQVEKTKVDNRADASYYFDSVDEFMDRRRDFLELFEPGDTIFIEYGDKRLRFYVNDEGEIVLNNNPLLQ